MALNGATLRTHCALCGGGAFCINYKYNENIAQMSLCLVHALYCKKLLTLLGEIYLRLQWPTKDQSNRE